MAAPAPPRKGRMGAKNALDDLVMLQTISEEAITETLKNRYAADQIYTNIGPVLIAINPFKNISGLYTDATIREYRGKKYFELSPHVYALADETYSAMISYRENQCVIISGESGSGKTETSKIIMQYISGVSGKSAEVVRVKDRLLSSNPVLEGFGNAKTVNNNNSSRFGKYMEVLFDYAGDPVGGRVTNYLLEKSRVVGPAVGERNFHSFYQICKGAGPGEREQYCIEGVEYYYYLSQTECFDVQGIDDVSDYKEMVAACRVVGLNDEEIGEVHRVLSAVLWLGNVAFTEDNQEKSSVQDPQVLEIVSHLLQVDVAVLTEALCQRQIQTGQGSRAEIYKKPNTASQADFCRDTLSKALYSFQFDWLVRKINESIKKENFEGVHIGILDIYGFEIFEFNSFEQLCINYVNEQLQQIFIELTLKAEQEEYAAEGITWTPIKYYNNKPVCDLISGKPGILSLCDDCCNTSKTDAMFCQEMGGLFGGSNILHVGSNDFTVRHYAGDVRYESTNFLVKNKDTLFDDLKVAIKASPCRFVKDHGWAEMEIVEGQKKRPVTVGYQFRQQVTLLMTALKACVPHYIRCIKPNMEKTPNNFNVKNIRRQVQYLGLLENVRVRRAGYAYRSEFARFVKRYSLLDRDVWIGKIQGGVKSQVDHITKFLSWTSGKEFAMGKTKIFIQAADTLFHLEDLLDRKMTDAVVVVQKAYRRYKQKRYYLQTRADGYDLVKGRKGRRRGSVDREYRGDYLDFSYNKLASGLLSMVGDKEKILFADRSQVAILRGKKSVLGHIGSLFTKTDKRLTEHRFLMLSDKALYSFSFELEEKTLKTKAKLFFRVPTLQMQSVTVSPYADNWMVFHFASAANVRDVLISCRRKTEFLALLDTSSKQQSKPLRLDFKDTDSVLVNVKKNKMVEIKWMEDAAVDPNLDKLLPSKKAGDVEVHAAPGVPPMQVKEPFRPAAYDSSSRPSLRALYDCKGNGVDELGFKAGEILFILKDEADGWYEAELNGLTGFVPATYVERLAAKKGTPTKARKEAKAWGAGATLGLAPKAASGPAALSKRRDSGAGSGAASAGGPSAGPPKAALAKLGGGPPIPGIGGVGGGQPKIGAGVGAHGAGAGAGAHGAGASHAAPIGPPKVAGAGAPKVVAPATAAPAAAPAASAGAAGPKPGGGGAFGAQLGAALAGRGAGGGGGLKPVSSPATGGAGAGAGVGRPAGRGGAVTASPPAAAPAKKSPWEELKTDAGEVYYYNNESGESSWDKPAGFSGGGGAPAAPPKKKSDWTKLKDDSSGDYYYYNEKTQQSQWDPPPGYTD